MKKIIIILFLVIAAMQAMNAMVLSVDKYGEVPAEGMDITVTEGETDILSGLYTMGIEGRILCSGTLYVTITRPIDGLDDEFCCAGNCTSGNKEKVEETNFSFEGLSDWYIHYMPQPDTDITITYHFTDGTDSRDINVRYIYSAQGIASPAATQKASKQIRNGQVVVVSGGHEYTITGQEITE